MPMAMKMLVKKIGAAMMPTRVRNAMSIGKRNPMMNAPQAVAPEKNIIVARISANLGENRYLFIAIDMWGRWDFGCFLPK